MAHDRVNELRLFTMFMALNKICECSDKPIVLIIDEVDTATNNQIFLDFLAGLRSAYLKREKNADRSAFHSVILAGVTDVKNIKEKIRPGDASKQNSPWNIAADFDIDMSLSEEGINGMLQDYEADHHTGMDTSLIAKRIREYTNGYPFLVSRICKMIDEKLVPDAFPDLSSAWTPGGVDAAVKMILAENNPLFESLSAKLENYPELRAALRSILMEDTTLLYNPDQRDISLMQTYGFTRIDGNVVRIDNRLFETRFRDLLSRDT